QFTPKVFRTQDESVRLETFVWSTFVEMGLALAMVMLSGAGVLWSFVVTGHQPDRDAPDALAELRAQLETRAYVDSAWAQRWMANGQLDSSVWEESKRGDEMLLTLACLGEWQKVERALAAMPRPSLSSLRGRRRLLARVLLAPESWVILDRAAS